MSHKLLDYDVRLTARMRIAERPGPLRTVASLLAHSGDSWFWLIGFVLIWLLGPPAWRAAVQSLALAVLLTAGLVLAIKFSVRRRRPEGNWGGIYRSTDPHSFPSGHATRASMLAVLSTALVPPWLALLLVIWAPLVSFARVAMGVHYLSDVLAGIALGVLLGVGFTWLY
jgi:membrane-associated phospholipid phosphatase